MRDTAVMSTKVTTSHAEANTGSLGASLALVVGFWWAATGLTLAMQRSALTSAASMFVASVFAVIGVAIVIRTRDETSVRSARLAFLGSALVWWWCSTLFYAGVGIDVANADMAAVVPPRSFELALQAILATIKPDLVGVLAIMVVAALVWRRANRIALLTLAVFWCTLQTAKLNVFMGVRNSGREWLPDHLAGLSQFFGPPQNSLLLPVTIVALCAFFATTTRTSRSSPNAFVRHGYAMIAFLLALAVLEHVMLGLNLSLPFWEIFRT